MDTTRPKLVQITLTAEHVVEMVQLYSAVFAIQLEPVAAYGTTLYRGLLHGTPLLICPNSIAGVEAQQNRHQFTYSVANLATLIRQAEAAGGQLIQHAADAATLLDPDGNTLVFQQER